MIQVAVVGCGYWGPNLVRNFWNCPDTHVAAVCDRDPARLERIAAAYPAIEQCTELEDLLARDDIDAVALATPVSTHAPLAKAALTAGKHVLVEKPLAASVADAEALVTLAAERKRVLMVDHVFVYSPAVRKMKELVDSGELGELYFVDSVRINLGLFQHDVNVVWDLATHDLSMIDHLVGRSPRSVSAYGSCHASSDIEDVAYLNLDLGDSLVASVHVNWLSPVKLRHFIIGGSQKSIVYNDLEPGEKVKVYNRGITVSDDPEARRGSLIGYRTGDMWAPHLETAEPLAAMVHDFARSILEGKSPTSDGQSGLRVVRILEAAQRSIKAQGGRITL